jgi:hypothetical protein
MADCDARVNATLIGVCGRPTTGISTNDCGHTGDTTCTQRHGQDGSRWCADPVDGCCQRVPPPVANQESCCTSLDPQTYDKCGNSWCPNSEDCKGILSGYCAKLENVTKPVCQLFCSKVENKPLCDMTMRQYCSLQSQTDQMCSCLLADEQGVPAPSCFFNKCTAYGYQTADHVAQSTNCPDFCGALISCSSDQGCEIDGNQFKAYCCQRHPELCQSSSSNNNGGTIGDLFVAFIDFWMANTTRKAIGGTLLASIVIALFVLIFLNF